MTARPKSPLTLSLSKGDLRRARLLASATKGLTVKPGAGGRLLWYWEPNRAEKAGGWLPLKFGEDRKAAQTGSDTRNAEIAAWRRGDAADPATAPDNTKPVGMEAHLGRTSAQARRSGVAGWQTISDHAQNYRTQYLVHLSPGHQRTAGSNLTLICQTFGDMLASDIQPHHLASWTDALRGRGAFTSQGRQVSDTTAHNRLRTFRALLAWIANPHAKFAQPKGRDQVWEADDRAAFIAAAYDLGLPNMAFALKLAFYTGQRTQSLLAFTEAQLTEMKHLLDPATRAALADATGKVWGWQFVQDKGQVPMHIPFEPELLDELRAVIARNRAIDRAPRTDGTPPRLLSHVLVNEAGADGQRGAPWLYRHFNRTWNRIKDHAVARTGRTQMDQLHWHDLRRSRVVELKRQGLSHDRIATLTGHAADSINEIMKVYGPVDPNMTAALIVDSASATKRRGQG